MSLNLKILRLKCVSVLGGEGFSKLLGSRGVCEKGVGDSLKKIKLNIKKKSV